MYGMDEWQPESNQKWSQFAGGKEKEANLN